MKKILLTAIFVLSLLFAGGCKSSWGSAGLGAAGGAVAAGGSYEYVSNREMKKIEQDYRDGKIDQREYEIRKDQIQRMSLLK
ncbi:MAG: hypothetical protein PHF37_04630 [Phycisphaerae bacterium]|nr:hypothetical protein [Phycisphaerae bacterium]